jgi:hypothetical protein
LVVGYLLILGRLCRVGNRRTSAAEVLRFIAAALVLFVPAFVRFVMRLTQTQ